MISWRTYCVIHHLPQKRLLRNFLHLSSSWMLLTPGTLTLKVFVKRSVGTRFLVSFVAKSKMNPFITGIAYLLSCLLLRLFSYSWVVSSRDLIWVITLEWNCVVSKDFKKWNTEALTLAKLFILDCSLALLSSSPSWSWLTFSVRDAVSFEHQLK